MAVRSDSSDQRRFTREDRTYLAVRTGLFWYVTLEGGNKDWMFWVLDDAGLSKLAGPTT
jgi:hypothetical protein